jgi:hypothetical protein
VTRPATQPPPMFPAVCPMAVGLLVVGSALLALVPEISWPPIAVMGGGAGLYLLGMIVDYRDAKAMESRAPEPDSAGTRRATKRSNAFRRRSRSG